jgi:hypothetical protein
MISSYNFELPINYKLYWYYNYFLKQISATVTFDTFKSFGTLLTRIAKA